MQKIRDHGLIQTLVPAKLLQVSPRIYFRVEFGDQIMSLDLRIMACKALKLDHNCIFYGYDPSRATAHSCFLSQNRTPAAP